MRRYDGGGATHLASLPAAHPQAVLDVRGESQLAGTTPFTPSMGGF